MIILKLPTSTFSYCRNLYPGIIHCNFGLGAGVDEDLDSCDLTPEHVSYEGVIVEEGGR